MLHSSAEERVRRMCAFYDEAPHARRAHPRPDHILPAAVCVGAVSVPPNDSGWPLVSECIHYSWVRDTMSLACYKWTNPRRYFSFLDPLSASGGAEGGGDGAVSGEEGKAEEQLKP